MTTDTKQGNFPHKERKHGVSAQAGYFFRHLFEMLLAMMVGMGVLGFVSLRLAGMVGYTDPLRQIPEVSALVMAFDMAVPMAAWMRYRGMEWGPISEMSGAMFAEVILLICVAVLGILPRNSLFHWQHVLMIPAMILPMLFRLDLYTGNHGSHQHQACH